MASPYLLALHGELTVVGKKPDGDSMRFIPRSPAKLELIGRADRLRPSPVDGSHQLRFEGIDTPETHYGTLAQPLGIEARDRLLKLAGFEDVEFGPDGAVTSAVPAKHPAVILTNAAEANGRPVSYVLEADGAVPPDGQWVEVDRQLLRRTLNAKLLQSGLAYLTLYTSTPAPHQQVLRTLAERAREAQRGVWSRDETAEFRLADQDSIGPAGALILPKLFRRCSDYLKALADGFMGTIDDWLVGVSSTGRRPEDDRLLVCGRTEVTLSAVVQQLNQRIRFTADPLDIVFVEK
ncbi:MAG TPA: thermonuclease family protein [Thermoleophilaceae bacterium]|jgi:endonuclease YncB( thermonuclease family)